MSYALPCPIISFPRPWHLPPQHLTPSNPHPAQRVASEGKGSGTPQPRSTLLYVLVLELVTFHLISCFSPFSHCPLGVAEVGVSGVPLFLPALPLPGAPPIPVLCFSAHRP